MVSFESRWSIHKKLKKEKYFYKFIVDGVWRCHPDFPQAVDSNGNLNNFIDVNDPDLGFHLSDAGEEVRFNGKLSRPSR